MGPKPDYPVLAKRIKNPPFGIRLHCAHSARFTCCPKPTVVRDRTNGTAGAVCGQTAYGERYSKSRLRACVQPFAVPIVSGAGRCDSSGSVYCGVQIVVCINLHAVGHRVE
jgi:hypothetical protein